MDSNKQHKARETMERALRLEHADLAAKGFITEETRKAADDEMKSLNYVELCQYYSVMVDRV